MSGASRDKHILAESAQAMQSHSSADGVFTLEAILCPKA